MIRWHEGVEPLLVPIDSVHQLPDNYRNGDVDALMESITVNGFFTAVTADKDTGEILVGNHRYAALLGLGATQIPVLWTRVDAASGKRIAVADNRLSDLARNDPGLLSALLVELSESEVGLLGTGWSEDEFHALLVEQSNDPLPEGEGFGFALNGIWQVVVEVESQEEAEELQAHLADQGHESRVVGL